MVRGGPCRSEQRWHIRKRASPGQQLEQDHAERAHVRALIPSASRHLPGPDAALGGVFVGGGIAPRMIPALTRGGFMQSFFEKGRLSPVLTRIPVSVVLDPKTAVWGAAAHAMLA